jgi:hypothetical protein
MQRLRKTTKIRSKFESGTYTSWTRFVRMSVCCFETKLPHAFHPLKPSGCCVYRQYNVHQFYVLPTQCIYVFYVDLRTNSDYFPIHQLTGFYNRDVVCLLRGTDWMCMSNSGYSLILKG